MGVLWDLAERAGVTCFGTSAAYIAACMKAGRGAGRRPRPVAPARRRLDRLAALARGLPLGLRPRRRATRGCSPPAAAPTSARRSSAACPILPVYEGELQARSLGATVEAWDPEGRPLIGEVGELVITEPMPSMPLYFWNDPDGERYRESYFDMYPGIWRHGDWIEITERGTAIISGRSDSTINRGGVRMGTAEIYRAVLAVDEVVDALVVDVGDCMPLFVVLREGAELDDELVERIRARIREDCSPRHVPNEVVAVEEVPRTLSGKVLELPVKRILMGTPPEQAASRDSLANPAALDFFVSWARRR